MIFSVSVIGMYTDIRHRNISNLYCTCILLFSLLFGSLYGDFSVPILRMICILLVGIVLFSFSIVGAGDVKLLAAYSLGISPEYWWLTLYLMFILGGVLALSYLMYGWLMNKITDVKKRGLPYGVPITLACLFGMWLSGL